MGMGISICTDPIQIVRSKVKLTASKPYRDADWIANWFGGEAVSLAVKYNHSTQFKAASYVPFHVNGTRYGQVRQYGNFSFLVAEQ